MNDIFNVSNFPFTVLYADDTCLVVGGKSLENLITLMNQELHLLYIWLQSNKLTLNIQKTYNMIFHRARHKLQNTTIDLKMGDCNLNNNLNIKNFKSQPKTIYGIMHLFSNIQTKFWFQI